MARRYREGFRVSSPLLSPRHRRLNLERISETLLLILAYEEHAQQNAYLFLEKLEICRALIFYVTFAIVAVNSPDRIAIPLLLFIVLVVIILV